MTFNLDFALFYAYTLCLFSFLALWMIHKVFRAVLEAAERWILAANEAPKGPADSRPSRPSETRLEAFTRI